VTLEERLAVVEGRPTGFDYMRIILACGVIVWHSIVTSYGPVLQDAVQDSPWRALSAIILPMFFTLSGFLVAGSLERCRTLVSFLGQRFIRIYPALTVEVLLSALLLGPLLTTVSLSEYFTDQKFWLYLVNVTGHIHYELPGLFLGNPNPETVNGQLWTVPFELYCYAAIALLALVGLSRRRTLFTVAVAVVWAALVVVYLYIHGLGTGRAPSNMPGYLLIICFLLGITFYLWRDRIAWSAPWGYLAGGVGALLLLFPLLGDYLAPLPIAYFTIYLGLCNPRKIRLLHGADYSYGIFLYGYVIQQAYMSLDPSLHHWAINIALALPTAALFAAFSWHWVEKPALNLRKPLKRLEDRWLTRRRQMMPTAPETLGALRPPARVQSSEAS